MIYIISKIQQDMNTLKTQQKQKFIKTIKCRGFNKKLWKFYDITTVIPMSQSSYRDRVSQFCDLSQFCYLSRFWDISHFCDLSQFCDISILWYICDARRWAQQPFILHFREQNGPSSWQPGSKMALHLAIQGAKCRKITIANATSWLSEDKMVAPAKVSRKESRYHHHIHYIADMIFPYHPEDKMEGQCSQQNRWSREMPARNGSWKATIS